MGIITKGAVNCRHFTYVGVKDIFFARRYISSMLAVSVKRIGRGVDY